MSDQKTMKNGTQPSFFEEQKNSCETCEHYSALRHPRERKDGAVIYGYCFARGTQSYSNNEGKGYAVFLTEGFCPLFRRKAKQEFAEDEL